MSWRAFASLAAAIAAAGPGCSNYPESYPPPFQRGAVTVSGAAPRHVHAMSDPGVGRYVVQDISSSLEGGAWRWTAQRPTLRFVLSRVENLKLAVDFSIAGVTYEKTGPVTVSFLVNGKLLDRVRYSSFGEKRFEKPVDPSWLKAGEDTMVAMEVNPVWVSPDGTKLGIILTRAGFVD